MSLPRVATKYVEVEVEGLGTIRCRPLLRKELLEVHRLISTGEQLDTLEAQRVAAIASVDGEGEDVGEWFDDLELDVSSRVFEAVMGVRAEAFAEKNSA